MAKRERAIRMSVEQPLWRAVTGYRLVTLLYAIGLFVSAYHTFDRPRVAIVYFAVLTTWTLATWRRVMSARACTRRFLAIDLALALTGILLTPVVVDGRLAVGSPTLPSIWTAGSVLAFALKGGWRWSAGAAALVGIADIVQRGAFSRVTVHNVLLVWVAAIGIGYVIEVARASERTLARALEIEAATRERERLARDIHDGVLQVLAMVQRRSSALGGEAAELGRLAGEQEAALRALVTSGLAPADSAGGTPAAARGAGGRYGNGTRHRAAVAGTSEVGGVAGAGSANGAAGAQGAAGANGTGGAARTGRATGAGRTARSGRTAGSGRTDDGSGGPAGASDDLVDVRSLLAPFAGARVTLSEPGAPVPLATPAARELSAAVGAALDNVRQHAGDQARAWILIEDEQEAVIVTVRDDGPGIPEGRLAQAAREGRLGVELSIKGRVRDLGGSAELISVPGQGTEVELTVPRPAAGRGKAR